MGAGIGEMVLVATGMGGARSLELGRPFWEKAAAAIAGKPAQEVYRIDLTLMTSPGFAKAHPEVMDQAVGLRMQNPQPLDAFLRQLAACNAFDSTRRTGAISAPALIVLGNDDPIFPIALADDFRKTLPQAKMIIYEKCGHAIHLEKPSELSCDIRAFLKG